MEQDVIADGQNQGSEWKREGQAASSLALSLTEEAAAASARSSESRDQVGKPHPTHVLSCLKPKAAPC